MEKKCAKESVWADGRRGSWCGSRRRRRCPGDVQFKGVKKQKKITGKKSSLNRTTNEIDKPPTDTLRSKKEVCGEPWVAIDRWGVGEGGERGARTPPPHPTPCPKVPNVHRMFLPPHLSQSAESFLVAFTDAECGMGNVERVMPVRKGGSEGRGAYRIGGSLELSLTTQRTMKSSLRRATATWSAAHRLGGGPLAARPTQDNEKLK